MDKLLNNHSLYDAAEAYPISPEVDGKSLNAPRPASGLAAGVGIATSQYSWAFRGRDLMKSLSNRAA